MNLPTDDRAVFHELAVLDPAAYRAILATARALLEHRPVTCPLCNTACEDRAAFVAHCADLHGTGRTRS